VPHYPRPFFRAPRGLWYVQIDGRHVNLGPDRDEAFRRYHDVTARGRGQPEPANRDAVVSGLGTFLDWCQKASEAGRTALVFTGSWSDWFHEDADDAGLAAT
jgi:hypothetical protein